ncbi:MAG TPA: proton-conducting transporter membrane subunit [Levilinea sp.]|nr:proton-conducting transporter membrane subunit [Levilinea sp.]
MNGNFILHWLIAIPIVATPLIYLSGRIPLRLTGRPASVALARWVALAALLATGIPLYLASKEYLTSGILEVNYHGIPLRYDGVSLLVSLVALTLGALVVLFSGADIANKNGEEKYYALLTAMTGSMIGLSVAGDLFNLWVWFELMAITSYTLIAFHHEQRASLEAGIKFLLQSAVSSVLILTGIALVLAMTASVDLAVIQREVLAVAHFKPNLPCPATGCIYNQQEFLWMMLGAGALILIGFGVKAALVPLHTWLPDAHSQAPSGISAMLSGIAIEAGLIAMLRALGAIHAASNAWAPLLLGFGAVNMLVGNLMALRQTQVKRLLAYSSISHVGYILLGFGIAISMNNPEGAAGGFFHLLNHAMMKGLAFLAAGALLYALHLKRDDHEPLLVSDLNGAARRYPVTALAFSVALLALGGLPPLAGFMSKWQIFAAGAQAHHPIIWGLVGFAALNSVLSLGYYAPLVNRMYRCEESAAVTQGAPVTKMMAFTLVVLMLAIVATGFWPPLVGWLTVPAADSLLIAFVR